MRSDINLDRLREARIGLPEIVYGQHKSREQLQAIAQLHAEAGQNLLITRCGSDQVQALDGDYDPIAHTFTKIHTAPIPLAGLVGVVYAGTSDAPVAREALATLRYLGCPSIEMGDCGIAGLHRLLAHQADLERCQVLICCAGFEGALPSVLGGLVGRPIIAVPTSVGYGVSAHGTTALHAMLSSCASGILVVNIDNGCGAAMAARRILNLLQ